MAQHVRMLCLYQQNAFDTRLKSALHEMAKHLYQQYISPDVKLSVIWLAIPPGQSYIAGEPSEATTVTLNVPDGTSNQVRHRFMSAFCEAWIGLTSCGQNDIILSVMDDEVATEFTQMSINRLSPESRRWQRCKLIWKLLISKVVNGHFTLTTNLNVRR